MGLDGSSKIDIGYQLSVDGEEGRITEQFAGVVESPGGAENVRPLYRVVDLNAELLAIAQGGDNRVRLMMKIYNYLSESVFGQILSDIANQRFSKERNRRLSSINGKREQASSESRCEYHCSHLTSTQECE